MHIKNIEFSEPQQILMKSQQIIGFYNSLAIIISFNQTETDFFTVNRASKASLTDQIAGNQYLQVNQGINYSTRTFNEIGQHVQ